jgi:hypothetical protein
VLGKQFKCNFKAFGNSSLSALAPCGVLPYFNFLISLSLHCASWCRETIYIYCANVVKSFRKQKNKNNLNNLMYNKLLFTNHFHVSYYYSCFFPNKKNNHMIYIFLLKLLLQKWNMERGKCQVCSKTSESRCSWCRLVFYCSKEHQKQHWDLHKATCNKKKYSVSLLYFFYFFHF